MTQGKNNAWGEGWGREAEGSSPHWKFCGTEAHCCYFGERSFDAKISIEIHSDKRHLIAAKRWMKQANLPELR